MGGVSEEQAADAAHQQAENAEDGADETEVVEEGEGQAQDVEDGIEAMDDDAEQQVTMLTTQHARVSFFYVKFKAKPPKQVGLTACIDGSCSRVIARIESLQLPSPIKPLGAWFLARFLIKPSYSCDHNCAVSR